MRRRLLAAILAFNLMIIMAAGYFTGAWFLSTASSRENTIKSGKLEISGPESITCDMVDVAQIYPGWEQCKAIEIANTGNLDFDYRMYIESENLADNLLYDGSSPLQIKVLRGGVVYKDYVGINNLGFLELGSIPAGNSDFLTLYLKLPEESDDSYQGKSADINFVFEAKQRKSGASYPSFHYVTAINISGEGGSLFLGDHGGTMQMYAGIEPANATNKNVTWSVQPGTGKATIDDTGLLTALLNGTVIVKAEAQDGSKVSGQVVITVQNIANVTKQEDLENTLDSADINSINLNPGIYNLKSGISSTKDVELYCGTGEAIVNIIKYDGAKNTGFGSKPDSITAGAGVTIYEDVAFVYSGSSIQSAIDIIPDNGVIYAGAGLFKGNIQINKPVTLLGSAAISGFTLDENSLSMMPSYVSEIVYNNINNIPGPGISLTGAGTSNVIIKGFLFSDINGDGITYNSSGSNTELNNIKIENNGFEIINGDSINFANMNRTGVKIKGNTFSEVTSVKKAIVNLGGAENQDTVIDGNLIFFNSSSNNSDGIKMDGGNNACISDNIIKNPGSCGISINNTESSIRCVSNNISNASIGIALLPTDGSGIKNINISNNNIKDTRNRGISVADSAYSDSNINIENNNIDQHAGKITAAYSAIYLQTNQGTDTASVSKNSINILGSTSYNYSIYGLYILNGSNPLNIYDNNLHNTATSSYNVDICGIYIDPDSTIAAINGLSSNTIDGFARTIYDGRNTSK